jgi:hypothetical protein
MLFFIFLLNDLFAQPSLPDINEKENIEEEHLQYEIDDYKNNLYNTEIKEAITRTFNKRYPVH